MVDIELCKYEHAALNLINGVDMNKVTDKHNVLQEEDRGVGKCMINRILWPVMN
ncbi:hypothetical protein VEE67_21000 [Escherichia coli]|nr:hypothetical protein ECDEC13B_4764 [Escherichia coli DEC13B]EHX66031.1 hypothetical protein ECDEC13D_1743 [Escherichia coli DEC13D]EHX75348.1 hypothetical protein ECDEC13E_1776 [Escherichia coli DEC13E]EIO75573.1 hypothetical protein ECTW09109_2436 [Escherichia coli TW09109]EMV60170.1 hypothetical protein EC2867750_1754 [Escherichia coli 2867750]EMV61599.1 hypothetical protein EC2871950_1639 [Escherichia coli 2871950]END95928.1 hypothetical protein ECP03019043_1626 [Escherichia coli P03019